MRLIQLGGLQPFFCQVDDEDFDRLSRHSWCIHRGGGYRQRIYVQANIKIEGQWKRVLMHRFIMGLTAGQKCDHRDNNGLNNQKSNLRVATDGQNQHNQTVRKGRFKGVSWHRKAKKWVVQIAVNGQRLYLGLFEDEVEAARAYDLKAKELHGDFAKTNF
jgi:hypothetical protein